MKKLLFCGTILFSVHSISQITQIPDANFEQKLIDLGYDTGNPDGSILTANINTISFLDCSDSNISSLMGIQDFSSLISLRCSNNQLANLDLSQNTILLGLTCHGNQLTSLDLSQNVNLTFVGCSSNQLSTLDLSSNTALTDLICSNNYLTTIDVTQNLALFSLHCDHNELVSLNLSNNTALGELLCYNNQLTSLDVTQNPALYWLQSESNQLTTLDLSQNIALIALTCHNNQLTCLNLKNGNNSSLISFWAFLNTNLTCIEVDDVNYSTTNWTYIDPQTLFSSNCSNSCSSPLALHELKKENRQILRVTDLMGQETTFKSNCLLIKMYDDGSTEKVFETE